MTKAEAQQVVRFSDDAPGSAVREREGLRMSPETLERLMTWARLNDPPRCMLLGGGHRPERTCADYMQWWFKPGYAYPCTSCMERRELERSVIS